MQGRLIDVTLNKKYINLGASQVVVLDEADSHIFVVIYSVRMPATDQRLNYAILRNLILSGKRELAFEQMNNAAYVSKSSLSKKNGAIASRKSCSIPLNEEKMRLLQTLLEEEWPDRAIIFANTKTPL
ncbi:unnamed protein product [Ranitomeya imitator]|uniref:Uncharacterized protein n=1 Tax=Ranitomeya imitator TaxID=111125 RepID=A0ABN9MJ85_9NEOB|nr:unnamed protein product [Ranitomeya imitator]